MPIEVPDTRTFAEPPPRRRRAATKPATVADAIDVQTPEAQATPEASSAFSRPVRRRPKSPAAPVPLAEAVPEATVADVPTAQVNAPVADPAPSEPVAAAPPAVVEERRGTEGVAEELAEVTDAVVVRLGGTRYAVAMDAVAEVGRPPHVTRVPGVPAWIAGVANWRGRIMPVLDLRILLGAPSPDLGVTGRIMVLARHGVTLAFLAERVEGVVSLELGSLEPVLLTLPRTTASVLAGQLTHPDGPIALLDLDTVFGLRTALPRVRRAG